MRIRRTVQSDGPTDVFIKNKDKIKLSSLLVNANQGDMISGWWDLFLLAPTAVFGKIEIEQKGAKM